MNLVKDLVWGTVQDTAQEKVSDAYRSVGYSDEGSSLEGTGIIFGVGLVLGGKSLLSSSKGVFGFKIHVDGNTLGSNGGNIKIVRTKNAVTAAESGMVAGLLQDLKAPNRRHYLNSINQKTPAKSLNTVIDPSVDVAGDVAAIRAGNGALQGNTVTVNGRVYGFHDGTLYPMSGDGFYTLDRGAFKALGVYNQFGNTARATAILDKMGLDAATRRAALNDWSLRGQ